MALGVLSALALMAPAAQADDTFAVAACVLVPGSVDGNTTVPSVQADLLDGGSWEPTGLLDTETGTFTFNGPVICGGADIAGNPGSTPDAIVGRYDIAATGTFVNLICGTGSANGTANLTSSTSTDPPEAPNGTAINTTFSITFAGGAGQLSIVVNGGTAVGVLGTNNTISGGTGAGAIDIVPSEGSCGTGPGVTKFLVNGGFYASLQG